MTQAVSWLSVPCAVPWCVDSPMATCAQSRDRKDVPAHTVSLTPHHPEGQQGAPCGQGEMGQRWSLLGDTWGQWAAGVLPGGVLGPLSTATLTASLGPAQLGVSTPTQILFPGGFWPRDLWGPMTGTEPVAAYSETSASATPGPPLPSHCRRAAPRASPLQPPAPTEAHPWAPQPHAGP